MAVVRPFRALRYDRPQGSDISDLTAPPYDVVGEAERERLVAAQPLNVVAVELADGPLDPAVPGNRYETATALWRRWRDEGAVVADAEPALYVLEQRYEHAGETISRKAFVAAVQLERFDAGVILPHERTLPKAIADRLDITRATAANLSQVFGMYPDPERTTDAAFAAAMTGPALATATDADGVTSTLWALRDEALASAAIAHLASQPVFIADGHHRYTTALAYRDERRASAPDSAEEPPAYDSVMMALVNMDDPGLVVWPTHRLAHAPSDFDADAFWSRLEERFEVSDLPAGHAAAALDALTAPGFIVRTRDGRTRIASLRLDVSHDDAFPPASSQAWRALDVAVLQELVLDPLFDIHPDRPATLERLAFSKDAHAALKAATDHDAVFVLRPTKMEQVAAVALAGETMPQKSTYFYPKLLSGLLFRSLE